MCLHSLEICTAYAGGQRDLEDQEGLHRRGDLELDLEGEFQEYRRRPFQEEEAVRAKA